MLTLHARWIEGMKASSPAAEQAGVVFCLENAGQPFAILLIGLPLLIYLVMGRVHAESGLFYFQPGWGPLAVLAGLFGFKALGPHGLMGAGMFCAVVCLDARETLMPFIVNGLKMCDGAGVRPARVGWAAIGVFALGLAVAFPVVFWANYNFGAPTWDLWAVEWSPVLPFDAGEDAINNLTVGGDIQESISYSTLQRVRHMAPQAEFLWAGGVGLGLVLLFSVLRLRFSWWPLHPILFLVWRTWPLMLCSHSFMLGWLIKAGVVKLGGSGAYRGTRNFMIGVIAGDLLGGLIFALISAFYAIITGLEPVAYQVF